MPREARGLSRCAPCLLGLVLMLLSAPGCGDMMLLLRMMMMMLVKVVLMLQLVMMML